MTDSMNFGPDWIRNLSSEGSTGGGSSGGTRYQLADFRYGREEMLALFDRNSKPPASLTNFKSLYSEPSLLPLALLPTSEEERGWQGRPTTLSGPPRGRGGSLERGGRISRGRGGYQYGRPSGYESGWGNGEQPDWSPRKEYSQRTMSVDNWRRSRNSEDDDGWRNVSQGRSGLYEKWGRSTSWRGEGDAEERSGPPERGGRANWHDLNRTAPSRRSWDNEDHLPEWATENPTEGGGTFDERGAFHGSDDELEGRPPNRRETGLQKSTSQQQITSKSQHPSLTSSKSTMSLISKSEEHKKIEDPPQELNEDIQQSKENSLAAERKKSVPNIPEKVDKEVIVQERAKSEGPPKPSEKLPVIQNGPIHDIQRNEESDFERLQEDFVLKLVVDEEPPKQAPSNFDMAALQPPPNLVAPVHDKWFYQDPQGQMQGPFANIEMAEWYKAGYFSNQLKVRRQCDERFFLLGELITMCGGANPFQTGVRFPTLKNDVTKMPDPDILQFQYLSQMAAYKQAQARILAEPWSAITLQQQELAAQRLIMQQQQVPQDLQYIQQPPPTNPLMHMINQMQQANKLPTQGLVDKQPQNISAMDPHLQLHMGNILSLQNRIPPNPGMANHMQPGLPGNMSGSMPPESLSTSMPSLQTNALNPGGMSLPGMQPNIPVSMGGTMNMARPTSHGSVDQLNTNHQDNDPISNLLKQLQQKQQTQQVDSLWQQNQYTVPNSVPPQQWQSQQPEVPMSMWDIQQNNTVSPPTVQTETKQQISPPKQKNEKEKEPPRIKDDSAGKELKKKKEQDEKQAKKEAEERRKQEQKKQEAEKKAAEERKKKEEERVKKELEKAKKEAEEKRMRELEEKRRLKEQRKAEEEAKKKSEETKKQEEERLRKEAKETEARRQAEERRIQQEQIRSAKSAPWSQSNSTLGMSLTDIQKAEREKRAQEAALQMQRLQEKEYQSQQQQQQEKPTGIQLSWAKKPVEPRKVKSLAEIQAEEQERLAKQAAESRLQKEKEAPPVVNNTSSIWNSQSLTWASASATNSQWSSSMNNSGGFWDDSSHKQTTASKPSTVSKSNSTNSVNAAHKQQQVQKQQAKAKTKKEDSSSKTNNHNNNNNAPSSDEFTNWCYKTLSNITTSVDIPTFVTFLRDIESALDVREYCKEYLGESTATQQFATNFLEKRRSFKPKNNAHKDDMCSPAPAITPSLQHSTEFQEVKGKNKKNKKSKMLKVDSRILGFNVTSAPDRINVGDRDYGDNS